MENLRLGDIVSISKGRKHSSVFSVPNGKTKRYIQIEDLRNDVNLKYTDEKGVEVNLNDVVIAWDGANAGTIGFNLEGNIGSTLARLRIENKNVDSKFLGCLLRGKFKFLRSQCTGATIPHISKQVLESISVPEIPISEQKKVASILEQADAAREKRRQANTFTEQFLQSAFIEMFGDPVKNEKKWERNKISELGNVQTGNTPSRKIADYYSDNYIEWIKTDNILKNEIYPAKSKEYLSEKGLKVGRCVEKDSILVTCIAGSPTTIGNVSLTDRRVSFNQQINSVTPFKDVNPLFLYWLFKICKPIIQSSTTHGMKRIITKSKFENIIMIKPPLSTQQKFAQLVEQVEKLRTKQRESERELENLFQSLMQKYFG